MVASSPFLCPSRVRRSLARSRETRLTRPNRRACSQAMFYLSFRSFRKHRQARSARKKNKERPSIFFFPHPYPLALGVNKSPEVYTFYSPCTETPLPSVKIRDRAPSPSFFLGLGRGGGGCAEAIFFITRARRILKRKWRFCEQASNSCRKNWEIKPLLSGHLY